MKCKAFVLTFIVSALCTTSAAAASISGSFCGIDQYLNMVPRAGAAYVRRLNTEMSTNFGSLYNYTSTIYTDSQVTASRLQQSLNGSGKTLFSFSGHGSSNGPYVYNGTILTKENIQSKHKYIMMYTCNWMTNGGTTAGLQKIYNTFHGTRLQLGFASQMYLDSREGTAFGRNLSEQTVINAFLNAARIYQPQKTDNDSIARVTGYTSARNDYIFDSKPNAPSYSSSPGSFSTIVTETIPRH